LSFHDCQSPGTSPLQLRLLLRTSQQVVPWSPIHCAKGGDKCKKSIWHELASHEMIPKKAIVFREPCWASSSGRLHSTF
jgi:hypothetical protein